MPLTRADTSARSWFEAAIEKTDPDERYAVRHVVPERFEAYAKILHPLFELPEIEDRTITWDEWERARREEEKREGTYAPSKLLQRLDQTTSWMGSPGSFEGAHRISWRALTQRYGMKYVPELSHWSFKAAFGKSWPRYLAGADEGALAAPEAWRLFECLRPQTDGKCRFWFSWSDSWIHEGEETEGVAEGDLFDLPQAMVDREASWPTAIWPLDQSWFVGSDVDLDCTLVGGPRALIDAILDASELETFEVSPSTRVGRGADTANA